MMYTGQLQLSSCFILGEKAPTVHRRERWLGPTACVDTEEKSRIPLYKRTTIPLSVCHLASYNHYVISLSLTLSVSTSFVSMETNETSLHEISPDGRSNRWNQKACRQSNHDSWVIQTVAVLLPNRLLTKYIRSRVQKFPAWPTF